MTYQKLVFSTFLLGEQPLELPDMRSSGSQFVFQLETSSVWLCEYPLEPVLQELVLPLELQVLLQQARVQCVMVTSVRKLKSQH